MKTNRIALSAAVLILGLAGALVGNSHASAATGISFESIAGLNQDADIELCIGVSGSYAVSVTCNSSANDQIWNQTYEYETTGYYQYENDNGQCGDLDQMPVRVSQVDGPR